MKRRFTEDSWRKEPLLKALVQAFSSCKTEEQMTGFLRDVVTLSELQAMSERFEVAALLARGLSYRQVAAMTGASTTTVTRVAAVIENGTGAYRRILHAHRHQEMRRKTAREKQVTGEAEIEQKNSSSISFEPPMEMKNDITKKKPSALQRYLQT